MAASTPAAFISALTSQLKTRYAAATGLTTIRVYEVAPSPDVSLNDTVVLIAGLIEETQEIATVGQRKRNDTALIPGQVQAYAGDWQPAMDRATAILNEIILELRDNAPSVGDQTRSAIVSTVGWLPAPADQGGWYCRGHFQISYSSRVS